MAVEAATNMTMTMMKANNNDDNIFCEEAVLLPVNDEDIIITSPLVCSSLTTKTNNLVADNFANVQDLVVDYVDEEREGIEFISDVNILDGEPMEDCQVCGISGITKVNNTFDPDASSSDDEPNNHIYKLKNLEGCTVMRCQ